jgi:hypothetical protein
MDIKIVGHSFDCLHKNNCICENCQRLDFVSSYRYLGLTIDCNFGWKQHVGIVCNKLRSILYKLISLSYVLDRTTLRMLYHALVDAVFSYVLSAYGRTFHSYIDEIKKLQLRSLKLLVRKNVKDKVSKNYDKLYKKCNILPIHEKVKYLLAVDQFISNDNWLCPKVINRNLRTAVRKQYEEPTAINYYGTRTRGYLVPRIFNILEVEESVKTETIFKRNLKE